MVKKSPKDLYRDSLSRHSKKKRQELKGPFRCPKCLVAKALYYQKKTEPSKQDYINILGKKAIRWIRQTTYLFSCHACNFYKVVVSPGDSQLIDEYNTLYDRELSFVEARAQRNYIRDDPIRLLRLSKCEVKMK